MTTGQGFLVRPKGTGEIPGFRPDMRAANPPSDLGMFSEPSDASWPGVQLTAGSGGAFNSTVILFAEGMSTGLDPGYDAGLVPHKRDVTVFTRLAGGGESDFDIQCLPLSAMEGVEVPIGFRGPAGDVTFSLDKSGMPEWAAVTLEDRASGLTTDLTENTYTTSVQEDEEDSGRFFLSFSSLAGVPSQIDAAVTIDRAPAGGGDEAEFTVTVLDALDDPVEGATVTVDDAGDVARLGGIEAGDTAVTDAEGRARFWATSGEAGLFSVSFSEPAAGADAAEATFITLIQHLIDGAGPGGTVELEAGVYSAEQPVVIDKDGLTLRSASGRDATFIDAGSGETAIIITADDVTVEGFWIGNFADAGIVILGEGASVLDNTIDGAGEEFGAGAQGGPASVGVMVEGAAGALIGGNSIEDCHIGIEVQGASKDTLIAGNVILRNDTGILGSLTPVIQEEFPANTRAINNSIAGSGDRGADWRSAGDASEERLNATYNWWGSEDGPGGEGGGSGDDVSEKVDYDPWSGADAAPLGGGAYVGGGGLAEDARHGVGIVSDGGEVFAGRSGGNPTGVVFNGGGDEVFFHLIIAEDSGLSEVVFEIGYVEPSEKALHWFDGEEWAECEPRGEVFADPERFDGYDGYVRVTINAGSVPSLSDFSGVFFALESARKEDSGGSGSARCFIATAAYGTPMAEEVEALRRLRDRVLLRSDAGTAAVEVYYIFSPQIAETIGRSSVARAAVRRALEPLVGISRVMTGEKE